MLDAFTISPSLNTHHTKGSKRIQRASSLQGNSSLSIQATHQKGLEHVFWHRRDKWEIWAFFGINSRWCWKALRHKGIRRWHSLSFVVDCSAGIQTPPYIMPPMFCLEGNSRDSLQLIHKRMLTESHVWRHVAFWPRKLISLYKLTVTKERINWATCIFCVGKIICYLDRMLEGWG